MSHRLNRLSSVVFKTAALLCVIHAAPLAVHAAETATSACDISRMKHWSALGTRWALGSDENGKALAIYDLSFSVLDDRTDLGKVGGPRPDPQELINELQASREQVIETPNEQAETDRAIANLTRQKEQEASQTGQKLANSSDAWLTEIPWKSNTGYDATGPRTSFTLDDIDVESTVTDLNAYQANVAAIENEFVEAGEGPVKMRDVYRHLKFERGDDGTYDIVFTGTDNPNGLRKIGGIACVRDVRFTARLWKAVSTIFGQIVKLIKNNSVNAVFATAMDRYTHFQELKLNTHLDMLTEALVAADRGESMSPLSQLSEADRNQLKISVLLSRDSAIAILRRVFRSPQTEWASFLKTEAAYTESALAWLQQTGTPYSLLAPRFAIETNGSGRVALLSLPRPAAAKKGPYVSYDYLNPDRIRVRRVWAEGEIVAVDFASQFIPLWGAVVRAVNNRLIQTPMDDQKRWEARLTYVLEERERTVQGEAGAWEPELTTLDRQRLNPLEFSREAMLERVRALKARLGI